MLINQSLTNPNYTLWKVMYLFLREKWRDNNMEENFSTLTQEKKHVPAQIFKRYKYNSNSRWAAASKPADKVQGIDCDEAHKQTRLVWSHILPGDSSWTLVRQWTRGAAASVQLVLTHKCLKQTHTLMGIKAQKATLCFGRLCINTPRTKTDTG